MTADALVPARAGSRRLPDKHWKDLAGRPLIDWTLAPALESRLFRRVSVSTDDPRLLAHALAAGAADFPLRPAHLAADDSTSADVVWHYLQWLRESNLDLPDWLMLLQPTSPFRSAERMRQALCLAEEADGDVVSLGPMGKPLDWCRRIDGRRAHGWPISGDLPAWRLNGAIYLTRVRRFLEDGQLLEPAPLALPMEEWESVDVDTPFDMAVARGVALDHPWEARP